MKKYLVEIKPCADCNVIHQEVIYANTRSLAIEMAKGIKLKITGSKTHGVAIVKPIK